MLRMILGEAGTGKTTERSEDGPSARAVRDARG